MSDHPKKSAGKKSAKDQKQKQALRSSLIDDDDEDSVSDAIEAPVAPSAPTASAKKKAQSEAKGAKKDEGLGGGGKSAKKAEETASTKKRDAKAQEKKAVAADEAPAPASGAKKAGKKKKGETTKKEENDDTGGIDKGMYVRRSIRNLDSNKVNYAEPKVTIKEFNVEEPSEDDEDEASDESDQQQGESDKNDGNQEDGSGQKKKKGEKKKKEKVKKIKKRKFKKGKWNPDVELARYDLYKNKPSSELLGKDDSIAISNLNIIRAIFTDDLKLLKKIFFDKESTSTMNPVWSQTIQNSAIDYMVLFNRPKMIEFILGPSFETMSLHEDYQDLKQAHYQKRAPETVEFINRIDTGMVRNSAYGVEVRPVEMSRGVKQGNNAFKDNRGYKEQVAKDLLAYVKSPTFFQTLIRSPQTKIESILSLHRAVPGFNKLLIDQLNTAIEYGQVKIIEIIFESNINGCRGGHVLNTQIEKEFLDVIKNPEKLTDKQLKSMTEKAIPGIYTFKFWHLTAFDPTGKSLQRIIDLNTDKTTGQCKLLENPNQGYNPYFHQLGQICPILDLAACCETSNNLEILHKYKYFGFDKMLELKPKNKLCSPLHRAIMWDRAENVTFLVNIDKDKILEKQVVLHLYTAIGLASEFGSIKSLKVLVEMGANVQRKHNQFREAPLITAASHNQYECVEYLCDNKARINCMDMYKRTPLIMAVKNGHTRLASLILQRGADWNQADSSLNTPLHYAAGFGWIDCLELLLEAGANLNAENNWKITPIQIAMLKNRKFCIKKLLEQEGVKVNCTDLGGRTLLSVTLFTIDHQTQELVQKILEIGGDPKIADLKDNTPLHYLALYYELNYPGLKEKKDKEDLDERMGTIGKQIIDAGADINVKNQDKLTVFAIAIRSRNIKLIEVMVAKLSIDDDPELLFNFCGSLILDCKYLNIIKLIVESKRPSRDKINHVNDDGFTPLLMFYKDFMMHYRVAFSKLLQQLMPLIKTRGKEPESYSEFDSLEMILKIYKDTTSQSFSDSSLKDEEKSVCLRIAQQLIEKHLVSPFVEMIQVMVANGANTTDTVGKIKEQKKEKVNPLIAEAKKQYVKDYGWDFDQESTDEDELTDNDKKIRKKRLRIKKKVEHDESSKYNIYGKKNAWHFAADMSSIFFSQTIFDQLLSFKTDIEAKDLDEYTPIMLQIKQKQPRYTKEPRAKFFEMAIQDLGIDVNLTDGNGVSYFLKLVAEQDYENAYKFYEAGANPNLKSKKGSFALKSVFQRNDLQLLKEFCSQIEKRGAKMKRPTTLNIHLQDDNKRNFMHFAMNDSLASIDASFKTLRYLLDKKVNYDAIDKDGRTPLHYAFCKIDEGYDSFKTFDPIEIVSNMLSIEDLDLNIQDKWGKTPLHYACRHGSTMSAIYMLQRNADLNIKDIFNNKPLGIALLYNQWNLATMLIQKDGDMSQTVISEDYKRQERIWKRQQIKEKRDQRNLGGRNQILQSSLVDPSDDEQFETDEEQEQELEKQLESDEKPLASQSIFKLTISRSQNALAYMTLSSYDNSKAIQDAMESKQFNLVYKILEKIPSSKKLSSVSNKDGQNLFQILFSNFDEVYFKEDSKLLEFIKILRGRGVDIKIKDNKGRQIIHQVCESDNKRLIKLLLKNFKFDVNMRDNQQNTPFFLYFKKLQLTHDVNKLKYDDIFTSMLKDYGADINGLYPYGQIFRSIKETDSEEDQYVQRMIDVLEQPEKAADPKKPKGKADSYMCPILFYYVLRENHGFHNRFEGIKELVNLGAKFTERDSEGRDVYMLSAIRNNSKILEYLFGLSEKAGKEVDAIDNKGWTAVHYVVKPLIQGSYENEKMLKLFRDAKFKMDHQDEDDMTPSDYAKEQKSQKLYKAFYKLKILSIDDTEKDKRSLLQEDEKMEDEDISQIVENKEDDEKEDDDKMEDDDEDEKKENDAKAQRMKSLVLQANKYVPPCPVPFEKHANQYIKANEQKYKIKLDKGEDFERHEQYEPWYLGKQYQIFKGKPFVDEEPKKKAKKKVEDEEMVDEEEVKAQKEAKIAKMEEQEYSVFLTKSNIENFFGQYLFYKLQLLYDTNQGVHMVLTRWGEMGSQGMNQRTPFETLNKAKLEFHKIFKEKTGNDFENLKKFQRVEKKYNLTKQKKEAYNYKELLVNFDWDKVPKSKLNKKVRGLIRSFAHPGYYRLSMQHTSINTDILPVSSIKPQTIQDAKKILNDLEKKIMKDHKLQTSGLGGGNFSIKLKVMEEIYELSNRYYELIPSNEWSEWQTPSPLTSLDAIKEQFDELNKIDYISQMSKIYLGALSQQQKQNPLDYIYKIFNTEFKLLNKKTIEYKMLFEYINNTWKNKGVQQIANIFTVNKEGEEQALREFHDLSNQKLLFHGSSTQNFVGIFYQGMQIQHSGTRTGQLLGPNALYFADRFDKAFMYARNEAFDDPNCSNASKLVLVCEVALGKTNQLCSYKNVTMLGPGYSSVKLRGKEELDMYKEVHLDSGLKVPQGQLMNIIQSYMPNLAFYVHNHHSEYTVYRPDQVKIKYVVQIKKKRPAEKRIIDKESMLKKQIANNTRFLSEKQLNNVIKTLNV